MVKLMERLVKLKAVELVDTLADWGRKWRLRH